MLELVLPGMIKGDKGVVVNVSSFTCWRPMPYLSSYPASKAALSFLSDALSDEYRKSNVKIQVWATPVSNLQFLVPGSLVRRHKGSCV